MAAPRPDPAPASGPVAPPGGRREPLVAGLSCAAGAALALLAAGQVWARVRTGSPGAGPAPAVTPLTGRELTGAVAALGWAALAGLAGLAATRGWARVAVGALLTGFGAGIAAAAAGAVRHGHLVAAAQDESVLSRAGGAVVTEIHPWWLAAVAGGVLVCVAGLHTAARGRRWPGMSSRYDPPGDAARARPAAGGPADPADLWRSLDRGEDPTDHAGPGRTGERPGDRAGTGRDAAAEPPTEDLTGNPPPARRGEPKER